MRRLHQVINPTRDLRQRSRDALASQARGRQNWRRALQRAAVTTALALVALTMVVVSSSTPLRAEEH